MGYALLLALSAILITGTTFGQSPDDEQPEVDAEVATNRAATAKPLP